MQSNLAATINPGKSNNLNESANKFKSKFAAGSGIPTSGMGQQTITKPKPGFAKMGTQLNPGGNMNMSNNNNKPGGVNVNSFKTRLQGMQAPGTATGTA